MLTRDQAVEAAFYSGANLYSFTQEREHNLDWMGPRPSCDRMDVKRTAAELARLFCKVPLTERPAVVASALEVRGLIDEPTGARLASFLVFCTVLETSDALIEKRNADLEGVFPPGPPPAAAASFEDEEDRIDARHPDPMARISGAGLPPSAPAPAEKPGRKGGKR